MTEKILWQPGYFTERNKFPLQFVATLQADLHRELFEKADATPNAVNSIEDLLLSAQKAVTQAWQAKVSPILNEFLQVWSENLEDTYVEESYFKQQLADHGFMEKQLEVRNFTDLEGIRDVNPTIWKILVNLSMMRQEEEMLLLEEWVERMPDENFTDFGISKNQLNIALSIANQVGPLINRAYLKQIDLGFTDGLPLQNPGSEDDGASSVYEALLGQEKIYRRITYREMFPETWPLIAAEYRRIAAQTLELCPENGVDFSNYLLRIAKFYDSEETDFAKLKAYWEGIEILQKNLQKSGWPINLTAAGQAAVGRNFNKDDANLVIGLKTKETLMLENKFEQYVKTAQKILNSHNPKNSQQINKADLYVLLAGMGSNPWWRNQGEADGQAICYTNSIEAISALGVSKTYQRLLSENMSETDRQELLEIMVMSTTLHEIGHTLFKLDDQETANKVGYYNSYVETIEEIKADTTGIRIFWEKEKIKGVTPKAKKYLQFIVGYCHEYIVSDSGSKETINAYRKMAEVMLARMIKVGGVMLKGEEYVILDTAKSFEAICELSKEILNKYADESMTTEKMAEYFESL